MQEDHTDQRRLLQGGKNIYLVCKIYQKTVDCLELVWYCLCCRTAKKQQGKPLKGESYEPYETPSNTFGKDEKNPSGSVPGKQVFCAFARLRLDLSKRKEWARLLRDCEARKVDRIITASVAGFTRNNKDLLEAVHTLQEMGVEMYFEQEDLDTAKMDIGSMQEITEMLLKESGSKAMGMTQAY